MKGSDEDTENQNLVKLINNDLREDEAVSEDDEVVFGNKNIHLDVDLHPGGEVLTPDSLQSEEIQKTETPESNEINEVAEEDKSVSSMNITEPSGDDPSKDDENSQEVDDTLSDMTDVSENNGDREVLVVPNTNHVKESSFDESSSLNSVKKNGRDKYKKMSVQLSKYMIKLEEEIRTKESLNFQLNDERDAKERLENSLAELQRKFDRQLKEEEELRFQLHKKDELNSILERKELELIQELVEVKRTLSENLDHQHLSTMENPSSIQDAQQSVNEKLIIDLNELQYRLENSEQLIAEKDSKIKSLGEEVKLLEEKIVEYENERQAQTEKEVIVKVTPEPEDLEKQIKTMVESVIGESHKKLQIKDLEEEVKNLKGQLDENKDKYTSNLSEALSTLKQVQDAYGEMRDVVLEGYKQEISVLHERVRVAEEKCKEDVVTGLRQELLDSRLQHERAKQGHNDEMELQQKKYDEGEAKSEALSAEIEKLKSNLEVKETEMKTLHDTLQSIQSIAEERREKIDDLNNQLNCMNVMKDTITEKEGLISELKAQLLKEADLLTKEHAEKEALQMVKVPQSALGPQNAGFQIKEVELMESVKRQNQRLEEEIEEMGHKVKLRGTKIKFLKKHIKELEEQRQKAESLMLVIPEMQKKIDELTEEKEKLKQDILDKEKKERDEKRKIEEDRKEEEGRVLKEKEEWEKRILGIGKCLENHDVDKVEDESNGLYNRPSSAPLFKPRPPTASAKRTPVKSHGKQNGFRAPTLNPAFLNSYPEGRKATQKMKQHQEKIILSSQNRDRLFHSVTKPMSYSNAQFKHISEGKYFPKISPRSKNNSSAPRVLVWGNSDGPGSKMVAVGDLVLTNMKSECSDHGQCSKQYHGIVKFIGFVDGNDDDVYIGLRLEEEVGYTDGVIHGKRYFRSEPEKGAFVHLNDIVEIVQSQTKHIPTLTM